MPMIVVRATILIYVWGRGGFMDKHERLSMSSYDKKAERYDSTFDGKFTYGFKELLLKAVDIPEGGKLLDVACGNGRFLKMLEEEQRFYGFGVDISENMVECAARMNPSMTFKRAGCDALPYEDGLFDAVTVCAAFHHFPDPAGFAREAFRVLKADGTLYIAEVYYPAAVRAILNPFVRLSRAGDVKFYSPVEIEGLLKGAGFARGRFTKEGHVQICSARK